MTTDQDIFLQGKGRRLNTGIQASEILTKCAPMKGLYFNAKIATKRSQNMIFLSMKSKSVSSMLSLEISDVSSNASVKK